MYEDDPHKASHPTEWQVHEKDPAQRFTLPIVAVAFLPILWGLLVFGNQCYVWLRYGFWPEHEFREIWEIFGLGYSFPPWVGIATIIEWIRGCSLAGSLIVVGIPLEYYAFIVAARIEAREREFIAAEERDRERWRRIDEKRNQKRDQS